MQAPTTRTLEQITLRKVYLRLVPYCFVLYILCYIVLFVLIERPSDARWLRPEERAWLESELAKEKHAVESVRAFSILSAMANPRVLVLSVLFGGIGMAGVRLVLFLPQILKSIGVSNTAAGLLTAVPYVFGSLW
jgi:ACS family tartrate transporter-like MFS transporter